MSILSSFGSAIGSAYNQVKSAVGSAVNYVSSFLPSGTSQTASAVNATGANMTPFSNPLKPGAPGGPMTPLPKGANYALQSQGGNVPNVASFIGPPAPISYSSGTKISSSSAPVSNYSSQSHNPNVLSGTSPAQPSSAGPSNVSVAASQIGAGTASIASPSAPSVRNFQSDVIGQNVSLGADPTTGLIGMNTGTGVGTTTQSVEERDAIRRQKANQDYLDSLQKPASQEDAYLRAQKESGIQAARQQMQNTQNEINGVTTQMNVDLLKLRDLGSREGVTEAVYGGQQAQVSREATIKLLPLQAQLAANQGNLQMAEQNLDTLFNIYSKDAQNSVDFFNKNKEAAYKFGTDEEKIKMDAISKQKQLLADRVKSDGEDQKAIAIELLKAGSNSGYRAILAIQPPPNTNSPTYAQDYANYQRDITNTIAKYGGSIGLLDRQIKQSQLDKNRAEAAQALTSLPTHVQTRVQGIAGQFDAEQAVKNYQTSAEAIDAVRSAGSSPTDDQSRIYAFAKVMDPNSVVREGEYKTVQDYSQSLLERVGFKARRVFDNSGFLTNEARGFMLTTLDNRLNSSKKAFDNIYKEYGRRIDKVTGKSDGTDYITDYSQAFNQTSTPQVQAGDTKVYNGVTYKVINGVWTPQ